MAVIRSRSIDSSPVVIPNPHVERARRRADEEIELARDAGRAAAEADLAAREQAVAKREAAVEQKIAAAEQAITERYEASFGHAIRGLAAAYADFPGLEQRMVQSAEAEVVRLALAVAGRVLRREVHTDSGWFEALLRDALSQVPRRRPITIRMHPEDAALVGERLGEFAGAAGGESLDVIADQSLGRGSCRLLCAGTEVDASVATGWQRLSSAVFGAIPEPAEAPVIDGAAVPPVPEPPPSGSSDAGVGPQPDEAGG